MSSLYSSESGCAPFPLSVVGLMNLEIVVQLLDRTWHSRYLFGKKSNKW